MYQSVRRLPFASWTLLYVLLCTLPICAQEPSEFWVSPTGRAGAAGTQADPFASLEAARDHLQPLLPNQQADITVWLEAGTYRLSRTFALGPEDSAKAPHRVHYKALPGAQAIISGATPVTGWSGPDANGIYTANVGQRRTRQLYVDGVKQPRSATIDNPSGFRPTKKGIEFKLAEGNPEAWRDPARWRKPAQVEAVCLSQWKQTSVPVAKVVPGCLKMQEPGWAYANVFNFEMLGARIWSFWQVTRFENALEFIDQPGEWFLDHDTGTLYYKPQPGRDPAQAQVELPGLQTLFSGIGVKGLTFEGLTFSGAGWLEPSSPAGYATDQSGFFISGTVPATNKLGHVPVTHLTATPGNLSFENASSLHFRNNTFTQLGAMGLVLGKGCQDNLIEANHFTQISSSAIRLSGVSLTDHSPKRDADRVRANRIINNRITSVCTDYADAAGIFLGFCSDTLIQYNTIEDVPWSGIACGWGWGMMDPDGYPGVPGAAWYQWGTFGKSQNANNKILNNLITRYMQKLWDCGAIYTTGYQGTSTADGLRIEGNVAHAKRERAGGNTFYTDGGTRYVTIKDNASYDNPIGYVDFGPAPRQGDPLSYSPLPHLANILPYGSDCGGCRTYGYISYHNNYWMQGKIPTVAFWMDLVALLATWKKDYPYLPSGFFNVCPYSYKGITYPTALTFADNHRIESKADIPAHILEGAGTR